MTNAQLAARSWTCSTAIAPSHLDCTATHGVGHSLGLARTFEGGCALPGGPGRAQGAWAVATYRPRLWPPGAAASAASGKGFSLFR